MDAYKFWVLKNRDLIRTLESLANGVMWILPERFGNSEIAPEAVYALVGIVTCVNQHILEAQTTDSFPWALVLSIIKDAEAVVEVAAQHFVGDDRKWGFLAVTEAVKACVRFAAFRDSGYSRMLLQGGEMGNGDVIGGNPQTAGKSEIGYNGEAAFVSKSLEVAALGQNGKMTKLQSTLAVMQPEKPAWSTVWSWKGVSGRLFMLGEVVYIFRPLVYVLMITKFGSRCWTPWLVSLAVEVTSIGIHSHLTHHRLSSAERDEVKRRKMMIWALYVVRDPFFAKYTQRHLEKAHKALNPVSCISMGKLVELSQGVQSRYTYTSGT